MVKVSSSGHMHALGPEALGIPTTPSLRTATGPATPHPDAPVLLLPPPYCPYKNNGSIGSRDVGLGRPSQPGTSRRLSCKRTVWTQDLPLPLHPCFSGQE